MRTPLNAKVMNEGLKKGWSTSDFATDLGVSQDEFIVLLKKTFESRPLAGFMRKLAKNASAKKKGKKPCSTNTKADADSALESNAISEAETADINDACKPEDVSSCISEEDSIIEDVDSCIADVNETLIPSITVAQIDAEIEDASIRLRNLEAELVQLHSARKDNLTKLSEQESWLDKILTELKNHQKEAEEVAEEINLQNEAIIKKKEEKNILVQKLSLAKQKLSALQKISILACTPDETTIESGLTDDSLPKYSFDYEEDKFNEILSSGDAEELTIREVKFVASLIKYCQNLLRIGREFEILFENENIERIFHLFF